MFRKKRDLKVSSEDSNKDIKIKLEKEESFIVLSSVPNKPGVGAKICDSLAKNNINIETFIAFSAPGKERVDMLIEVKEEHLFLAMSSLNIKDIGATGIFSSDICSEELTTLIIKGKVLRRKPGVGAKLLGLFSKYNANVWALIAYGVNDSYEVKIWVEKKIFNEHPEVLDEIKKLL